MKYYLFTVKNELGEILKQARTESEARALSWTRQAIAGSISSEESTIDLMAMKIIDEVNKGKAKGLSCGNHTLTINKLEARP